MKTNRVNRDPWSSQRLNHQSKNKHRLDLGLPHSYVADVQLDLHVGPEQLGIGAILKTAACPLDMFYYLYCIVWPQGEWKCLA